MPNTAVDCAVSEAELHVVAAVIRGNDGRVFLAKRPSHISQGGKWEFPGGKVEVGETRFAALQRELLEEIGITVVAAKPLIQVRHRYVERLVRLDVWEVTQFTGEPHGREGQETRWVSVHELTGLTFPAANLSVITAAQLPSHCLITPEPSYRDDFLVQLETALRTGMRLVVFRAKSLVANDYMGLAADVIALAHGFGAKVILNSPPQMLEQADGLHLTSSQLWGEAAQVFPRRKGQWLSASCHDGRELQRAADIGADFAFLSPVLPTLSHPNEASLGWEAFAALVENANMPVYALGGMTASQATQARQSGGQGIAAIRSLWSGV